MSSNDEIIGMLVAARAEKSVQRSRQLFQSALALCAKRETENLNPDLKLLKAQIHAEIAVEEGQAKQRSEHWRQATKTARSVCKELPTSRAVDVFGSIAVDCFQDNLSDIGSIDRQKVLREARDQIDAALKNNTSDSETSILLARKSSILRHLALFEQSPAVKHSRLEAILRCAEKANLKCESAPTLLEEGIANWSFARYEHTDEGYVNRLRKAESCFTHPLLRNDELALLTLSRFYRLTYQPLRACEVFPRTSETSLNLRRRLRASYVFAESCIQLWYANFPNEILSDLLMESRVLIETAITAGYRNARLHVALAYICAIQDGAAAGETVLARMISNSTGSPWTAFLRLLENPNELDAAANGLILGINESSVWTSLGSYAKTFIADKNLSEVLYRGAVQLDGHNPIALTNLARFLIANGSEQALAEARKCLQKASTFSDKRFKWWRTVQADLHKVTGEVIEEIQHHELVVEAADSTPTFPVHFANLRGIRSRFRQVQGLQDEQKRGYELEQLFCALASLTFGASLGSYQVKRPGGGHRQVDAYFEHRSFAYRVECKWRREETTPNDIIIFASKLDAAGVSGLFVSMAGFTDAAIAEAKLLAPKKMIIFLNGEEAQKVLVGEINFDQLLTLKETWFRSRSEPYYKIIEVSEVA